jgi:uncharacterized protein YhaN
MNYQTGHFTCLENRTFLLAIDTQKAEPMPFIGDDLLASFDDERIRRGITALAEIGTRIQPILFTHHSRVVELAQQELGEKVDVINLD